MYIKKRFVVWFIFRYLMVTKKNNKKRRQKKTYFFVVTFLPFTKLVDVLMRLTFPLWFPPLLNVDNDVNPPLFIPPNGCENISSISEKLKNGDITFDGCDDLWCLLLPAFPFEWCRRPKPGLKNSSNGLPPKNSLNTSSGSRKTNGNPPNIKSFSNGSCRLCRWLLLL